jgi:hypothetical protein
MRVALEMTVAKERTALPDRRRFTSAVSDSVKEDAPAWMEEHSWKCCGDQPVLLAAEPLGKD